MRKNFSLYTLTILALFFLTACPSSNSSNNNKTTSNNSSNNSNVVANTNSSQSNNNTVALQPDSHLNLANYTKLTTGISYQTAVKIIGLDGKLIGNNDIPGTKTSMYEWRNPSGAFIKIVFQNDKLIDKVQTGLQ